MEKFNLSLKEAYLIIREELKIDSTNLFEAYWDLDREAKRGTFQVGEGPHFEGLTDEDW